MSKYVKDLIGKDLSRRLSGIDDALLVSVAGLDANRTVELRRSLRERDIQLMVVKNSLARRAVQDTPLAAAFEGLDGPLAIVWGGEDIVSLAKEVVRFASDEEFKPFSPRGGVMDGAALSSEQVTEVSKWPTRDEQLSLLVGQILGPGATLAAQILGPGATVAGQVKQKSEEEG